MFAAANSYVSVYLSSAFSTVKNNILFSVTSHISMKTFGIRQELDSLVFRYNSEDLWLSIAYFRKGVKIDQSTCRCTPPPTELKKLKLVREVCDGE